MADLFSEVKSIENKIINHRRNIHKNAEIGFDLPKTTAYIEKTLNEIGCKVFRIGKSGIYTLIGDAADCDECVMLRADMDGLPITEESGVDFSSKQNMHSCGHDMHTAMLLGAAEILQKHSSELKRPVKLLFQPAEEILSGAKNMIENGILENPKVTSAFMVHVIVNSSFATGTVIVNSSGISAPASDYFEINVIGKGCHGAMPNSGVDPIIASCDLVRAIDSIKTRELSIYDNSVLTVGTFCAGSVHNVIPDKAIIKGTFRCFDNRVRETIKNSLTRISKHISSAYQTEVEINFPMGCPCLNNDGNLSEKVFSLLSNEFGKEMVINTETIQRQSNIKQRSTGSEDFAYYTEKVPSLMLAISAGSTENGYSYPLHHPKNVLDEKALVYGALSYATIGLKI